MVPGNSPSIGGVIPTPDFHEREPSTSTFPLLSIHDTTASSRPALQPTRDHVLTKTQFGICHFFFHCHAYLIDCYDMLQLSRAFILSPDHDSKIDQVPYMMNMIEKNMHQGTCEYGLPHTVFASGILLT